MIKKSGTLSDIIAKAFAAFAYEHSGEMLSLSRKKQILLNSSVGKSNANSEAGELDTAPFTCRILLAFDKDIESELIKYSIGAAKNFDAKIDILTSLGMEKTTRVMRKHLSGQTIAWGYNKLDTELLEGIANYTSNHSDVVFMVTSQHQALSDHYTKTKHAA